MTNIASSQPGRRWNVPPGAARAEPAPAPGWRMRLPPKESLPIRLLVSASVLMLYFRLVPIGNYNVTVGGICVAIMFLLSLRRVSIHFAPVIWTVVLIVWPLFVYAGCSVLNAELTPEPTQFLQSYALWAVSVLIIAASVVSRRPPLVTSPFTLAVVILLFAALQVLLAGLFGSLRGFEIMEPFLGIDVYRGYIRAQASFSSRAIGFYYEPSMCGRIVGTLLFMDILLTRKVTRNVVGLVIATVLIKSLGLLVLAALLGLILFGRSAREFFLFMVAGMIVFAVQGAFIAQRVSRNAVTGNNSSTYTRTVAPLNTVGYAISHYPLGVPIGSADELAIITRYVEDTGEHRVTNGAYELIMMFGVFGVAIYLGGMFFTGIMILRNEREYACAILYLLMSTAISGSYLAIESSLMSFYFIAACLRARQVRLLAQQGQAAAPAASIPATRLRAR